MMGEVNGTAMQPVVQAFEAERTLLWDVAYRITGEASEADDLVQEAFARVLEHRPSEVEPLRLWLMRVVTNLAIDRLRRRQVRGWIGPWLPTPVEDVAPSPEERYQLRESATLAYLFALEALRPSERAVLLLRDVVELSTAETAHVLGMGEANVKVTLHRARKALDAAGPRVAPSEEERARHGAALERFAGLIQAGDLDGLQAMLSEDVTTFSDGGGKYAASKLPVQGRAEVARLYVKLAALALPAVSEVRDVNGLPAWVITNPAPVGKLPPHGVLQILLDPAGKICRIYSVLCPEKLGRVRFPGAP